MKAVTDNPREVSAVRPAASRSGGGLLRRLEPLDQLHLGDAAARHVGDDDLVARKMHALPRRGMRPRMLKTSPARVSLGSAGTFQPVCG